MKSVKSRRVFANTIILVALLGLITLLISYALASWNKSPSPMSSPANRKASNGAMIKKGEIQFLKAVQLEKMLAGHPQRLVVLDIQDRDRFRNAHVPGSVNIPSDEVESRAVDELSPTNLIIVVDCACDGTDNRSLYRRESLMNLGFSNVAVLEDGVTGWKIAGFVLANGDK